jgi:peptide deformylase
MIITDEKILRQPCIDVLPNEVGELIERLERELKASPREGIGLAAPQIGIHKRIAIVRINPQLQVNLVNCRIAKQYDPILFKGEGCLSMPDCSVDTMRYQEVCVVDNELGSGSLVATGLMSIAIQHELDHVNGILMTDRKANKAKSKQRPNDLCLCGSGRKYKRCCG